MSTVAIIAIVGGCLIALCCIGGVVLAVAGDGGSETASDDADSPPVADGIERPATEEPATPEAEENQPGIGTPARDGKFEFVVSKIDCDKTEVGTEYLNEKAQGQFCLVSMSVKNIGDEARTLDATSQYAYDASDRKLNADGTASLYANKNHEVFLNEINPGNRVDGIVVFDIPKDAKLAKLELHDSPFSGGVTVKVS